MRKYACPSFGAVKITGAFWSERLDCVLTCTILSQHQNGPCMAFWTV